MALFPLGPPFTAGLQVANVVLGASFTRLHLLASALDQWLKPGPRSLLNEAAKTEIGCREPAVNGGPDVKKPGKPGCESGQSATSDWRGGLMGLIHPGGAELDSCCKLVLGKEFGPRSESGMAV